ncbi:MAG: AAA family ATPase [Terriglobales bacterium]
MAAGSIHPDSGEEYSVLIDAPVVPLPEVVRRLPRGVITGKPGSPNAAVTWDGVSKITDHRNMTMISILGRLRAGGADDAEIAEHAERINTECVEPCLEEAELARLVGNACKFPVGEPDPVVLIGGKPSPGPGVEALPEPVVPVDWRTHYHTKDELENTPAPVFLIDGFLLLESITAVAAPVGQRKSLIALNVAHALCTGEPLFGNAERFAVITKPTRVLYLCPEMGIRSFTERVRRIGLMPHTGETFFCRTMSAGALNDDGDLLRLEDLTPDELSGAVLIIDTAIRYLEGDENSSQDMRAFAKSVFKLSKKCAAIVLLHHSAKAAKEAPELSLENSMRGSGELGAFVTCCWATKLQDPENPYKSPSYLKNVKPRDFDAEPFEVTSDENCRLHFVGDGTVRAVLVKGQGGNKSNRDGQDEAARTIIAANLDKTVKLIREALSEANIKRSIGWVSTARAAMYRTQTCNPF